MFELRLIDYIDKVEAIAIRCINCKKEIVLYLKTLTLEEMITKFVLNEILHHVGMLWIVYSNKKMKYEMGESNHPNFLNKGPWYNTYICSRSHVSFFEYFITHARTDRYNLLCSIFAHDKIQPSY